MSYYKPNFRHPQLPENKLGLTSQSYEGAISTLCAGCGHDSISAAIIHAVWSMDIEPHRVAKVSGIGCSSKSPTYFLNKAHGFNSVHGRMPSVATGANAANRDLTYIGVSGDGDTASIGMGQFAHVVRRNLNMMYVVENNGCYGLTKGQDSATADEGSVKKGYENPFEGIDLVNLALELGATFVARSFSGDKEQLVPLMQAALAHEGFALIDVVSPCVTFNNHKGSTKSYDYTRDHVQAGSVIDFVPVEEEITLNQAEGTTQTIELHNGDSITLTKTDDSYNPQSRQEAINAVLTESRDLHDMMKSSEKPLNTLGTEELCPGAAALEKVTLYTYCLVYK